MTNKSIFIAIVSISAFFISFIGFSTKPQAPEKINVNMPKAVTIGNQVWMVENLNVTVFNNGDMIPEAKTNEEWVNAGKNGKPAMCYYDNDTANGRKYGILYNFYAVSDPRGLSPDGWRVPSNADWSDLTRFLGSIDIAGVKLKSTEGWTINGNNKSGFTGLPGGYRSPEGSFSNICNMSQWWSTSGEVGGGKLVYSVMLMSSSVEAGFYKVEKEGGFYIRCIKN